MPSTILADYDTMLLCDDIILSYILYSRKTILHVKTHSQGDNPTERQ
jgi:hypothetical protein